MIIELNGVSKQFQSESGTFHALKNIDIGIRKGEFVAVIGKSGSGKSTLINMITGIDRPTSGSVVIDGEDITRFGNNAMAQWRGRAIGVIFQFFQLLPTLSLLENVMLPMDLCQMYKPKERRDRALSLLAQVGMEAQAHKFPSAVSGGQQQRVAIARSLANDPPILVADEPTGSLDSKTAEAVFRLFEDLASRGRTIVMVTHDNDLAHRVGRQFVVADGEVVNEYVIQALPNLDIDEITTLQPHLRQRDYSPGAIIIREGDLPDGAYIVTQGQVEVVIRHPSGGEIVVNRLGVGQYFGEIAMIEGGRRTATVRAAGEGPVRIVALGREAFDDVLRNSALTRQEMNRNVRERLVELARAGG